MIVGLHCPVLRGFDAALAHAKALRLPLMQMLPYRRHHRPSAAELAAFRAAREAAGIRLVAHSRFVPSLASSDPRRRAASVRLLAEELRLSEGLGAEAYIVHAAAYSPGGTAGEGTRLLVESLAAAREGSSVPVWLENVPGGGRRLGGTLEELAAMGAGVDGFCLDTAHAWAAGYDLSTAESAWRFLGQAHRLLKGRVKAFHLNDTRAALGSHREHHASWGEGYLGAEGLRLLLEQDALGILETPFGEDERNLAYVRTLLRAS